MMDQPEFNNRFIRASSTKRGKISLRTQGQMDYVRTLRTFDVTLCYGPAGTGKTFLGVASALEHLNSGQVHKIVLTRPAVETGEKLGHLPGDFSDKVKPYLQPLFDSLLAIIEPKDVQGMLDSGVLEIAPLAYMRGRTFNDTFMVLDEAQNTVMSQMKMYLTRIGFGSKCLVVGDLTQVDLPTVSLNGFSDALKRLAKKQRIGVSGLTVADVQRHPVVQDIIEAYDDCTDVPEVP